MSLSSQSLPETTEPVQSREIRGKTQSERTRSKWP